MFNNIVGNDKIKELLVNTVQNKKVSHSYLFTGPEGIGKKQIAKEFAKMMLCLDENNKYCLKCKSCIEFDSNNNPDFIFIEPGENATIGVEQIRQMQAKIQEKPIISKNKIYIIDNADTMTVGAQNCLLKTLEEPPKFVTIILIGANENAFLSTIKSRCMIIHFEQIHDEEMKKFLEKEYDIHSTSTMLQMFQGSISKAIELKDKSETYEKINILINNMDKIDLIETVNNAEVLYQSKEEIQKMLEYVNSELIKKAKLNYKYTNCVSIVENTKKRLKQNCNYDMCIDNMIWNIWREVN